MALLERLDVSRAGLENHAGRSRGFTISVIATFVPTDVCCDVGQRTVLEGGYCETPHRRGAMVMPARTKAAVANFMQEKWRNAESNCNSFAFVLSFCWDGGRVDAVVEVFLEGFCGDSFGVAVRRKGTVCGSFLAIR